MKSINILVILLAFVICNISYAQRPALKVGNNPATIDGSAALDVESTNKGFLPPRMTTTERDAITNPAKGLIVYNTTVDCLQLNKGTPSAPNWECVGGNSSNSSVVVSSTGGFNAGNYINGVALSGRNYSVTLTNNSFSAATIPFAAGDLVLSGVSGLSVGTPTGNPALTGGQTTLAAGSSITVTYPLNNTAPGQCGTLTGAWTKLSLSSTKTVTVSPNMNCALGAWTTDISPSVVSGLINGTTYSGTYTIPYTAGGCTLLPESYTQSGLTFSYQGGSVGTTGGLVYALSGTYTGSTGGTVTFTTMGGCSVYIGGATSCNNIKLNNPLAANGVYTIDPDGLGTAFGPTQAVCNMTDRGGGWTLVLKSMAGNNDFLYSSTNWTVGTPFNSNDFDITSNSATNALYDTYNSLSASSFWVDFVTTSDIEPMNIATATTAKSVATGTGRTIDQAFGCFTNIPSNMIQNNEFSHMRGYAARLINVGWGWDCGSNDCTARVRFGVATNNETELASADSMIGLGLDAVKYADLGSGSIYQLNNNVCGSVERSINGFQKALLWVR